MSDMMVITQLKNNICIKGGELFEYELENREDYPYNTRCVYTLSSVKVNGNFLMALIGRKIIQLKYQSPRQIEEVWTMGGDLISVRTDNVDVEFKLTQKGVDMLKFMEL